MPSRSTESMGVRGKNEMKWEQKNGKLILWCYKYLSRAPCCPKGRPKWSLLLVRELGKEGQDRFPKTFKCLLKDWQVFIRQPGLGTEVLVFQSEGTT